MADKIRPQDVADYPHERERKTYISTQTRNGRVHHYVIEYWTDEAPSGGRRRTRQRIIGKVVDMHYYPMEEYKRLFLKDGSPRINEGVKTGPEAWSKTRKHNPNSKRRPADVPDIKRIRNLPKDEPNARLLRNRGVLYVVSSVYTKEDGAYKEHRRYLGRVIDGAFVSSEEYRLKHGRRRGK